MPVFTGNIPGILRVGDRLEIGGKIKENARKMSVNLCAQEGEEPRDVVLHFDVRFHRDNIISLSRKNGVWIGSGNYDTNYNMFVPGTLFRIVFEVKDTDVITIYCQGKFHSNFLPKIPLTMARYIVAWADVEKITHCYFYLGSKGAIGDEAETPVFVPPPPRPPIGENKRCSRLFKKTSPAIHTSYESSNDEKPMQAGRSGRHFYEALMCTTESKFSPEKRHYSAVRNKINYFKKCLDHTHSEKRLSDDISTEIASKNLDSSAAESDLQDCVKKRGKRRFAPFFRKPRRNNN